MILFSLTTLLVLTVLPWYAWVADFSTAAWVFFVFIGISTAMSITGGYHRLWAHRAYEAHPLLKLFYMLFGAMALQNSILIWGSMHRVHHAHVDEEDQDPYSIRRGLWYAHMGWMVRNYPCHQVDFSNAKDLLADPIVSFQHRHYLGLALGMNIGFPLLIGSFFGDPWGFLLLGGLLRLVLNHHFTFFINSLAHYWGRRPYTTANSARDNDLIALFTFGEGYHNYHHLFQWDYRNGIRWWMFDPTKWLIALCARIGLASKLKRVPEFTIQRAMLERQFQKAREQLERCRHPGRLKVLQGLLQHELDTFGATLAEFRQLQAEKIEAARRQLAENWENSEVRKRLQMLEDSLRLQRQRVRLLHLQTA
ncbi:MAG TPA: fatty acid desaturase [Nevskiaceae bacterium]|nr:fatty acid desaturase [Nevskiaceae bacterium]